MKLATLRTSKGTTAAVVVDSGFLPLEADDAGALLAQVNWRETVEAALDTMAAGHGAGVVAEAEADLAPAVTRPGKVVCCGLNYTEHILEMGRELPEYPTLFAKFADSLTGANDRITVQGSDRVDWEAELAVVVGKELHHANEAEAAEAIAGYCVANDVSMRDWQNRTLQWLQGKAFDDSTPLGPVIVTADEFEANPNFSLRGYVNGELVQSGETSTLVFGPASLLAYISTFATLRPGDVVLTGTPGGVGSGMKPPRFLADGDVLTTEIDGLGRLENTITLIPAAATSSQPASERQGEPR
ncbi:fumarylacetoacetate hydrolase family protein [Arthrobacter roseus]|uniref:fumarylacetoacetate hydrolase family protein n=1 Tax=Arthrobacter roseus TaxID=136274 RepID=UPI0019632587|nr:fumarylacetoacetate hydrolase family protein [Arthrobacter roseus]MBM7847874.1 2-keto-4-pentenoate hydratase/2-oxohepta-3-ene-1,7-dioic acid hydratase in catechol pathway [Arthrobacter roseus]